MNLRDRLAALFSPTRRLVGAEGTPLQRGGPLGPVERVVPRAQCVYRRMEFAAVARNRRAAAADLAVRRAYPEARAQHYIAWSGSTAHAWIWPGADAAGDADQRWLPESVLLPPLAGDGERLLALAQGCEGQVWRQGELHASRWWPQPPDEAQWRIFLRASGVEQGATARVPMPQSLPWTMRPWGSGRGAIPWTPATLERLGWAAGAVVLGFALGWQLASYASWSLSSLRLSARLDTLRQQAMPLLDARERAQADLDTLTAYRRLQAGLSDYRLMADVVAPLPADARLVGWRREGRRLQATLQSAETDPRVYVSAFQQHPLLSRVTANPAANPQQIQLDFELPAAPAGESP